MGLSSGFESNAIGGLGAGLGGAGFGFGGGWGGGIPPVGLFGLTGFGDRGHDHCHKDGDDCSKALFTINAIGNLKDTISLAKDSLNEQIDSVRDNMDSRMDSLKDALTDRIESTKDQVIGEGRALGAAVCEAEKTSLQQFYQAALQAQANTTSIKDQATQFFIANDNRFDALAAAGVQQTAAILARINQAELDALRNELAETRHGLRTKEMEINVISTNTNIQQQMQQQAQIQTQRDFDHIRRFDSLFSQVAKSGQDIIAVGSVLNDVSQKANPVNVKS